WGHRVEACLEGLQVEFHSQSIGNPTGRRVVRADALASSAGMTEDGATLEDGIRIGVPFGVAAGLVGISFGVVAQPIMGATAAIAMSMFVFAGAAQFESPALLASGGSATTAILTGIMLNARFLPMGIAVASSLPGGPWLRALQ